MKVNFTDIYGQYIEVHDETASGNVRLKVNTMQNLNQVRLKKPDECELETDISLDYEGLRFLIETLYMMARKEVLEKEWFCSYCGEPGGEPFTVYSREWQGDEAHGGMVEWANERCSLCKD